MDFYAMFMMSFIKGGVVMWPILMVSIVCWTIGMDRLFYLNALAKDRLRFWEVVNGTARDFKNTKIRNTAYRTLLQNLERAEQNQCSFKPVFREFLIFSARDLERGFTTINAWIATAPLLGLLGTVAGMIQTFEIITQFGIGNPHLMAEGISVALITTQAGLTVAFPAMLLLNHLVNKKRALITLMVKDGEELSKKYTA